ncbi:hypothetical protein EYC84_009547 [Monilinia fructicola]|uniref:Major facilitator superfamily (MFS) profile domain-containing protein n=1 Tax=Monilinia fructicola TaxID=38448 RepID=A0A5M9JBG0_MONFR|nr:hypothetical protein EYC84_009547 [Monilinia fructicola]
MFKRNKNTTAEANDLTVDSNSSPHTIEQNIDSLADLPKTRWERLWPAMACGSGLFSDGYINNVIGSVSTILGKIYGTVYTESAAVKNISAITFAGTVAGMIIFGYTSDKWGRANTLTLSTLILFVFAALGAGAYGYHGSAGGLFAALAAYRFLVGVGIGGEYPAGSVACSEASGELKSWHPKSMVHHLHKRHDRLGICYRRFCSISIGCYLHGKPFARCLENCTWSWCRASYALDLSPTQIEGTRRIPESMKHVKIPYGLVFKYYWFRLFVVSLIWFIYDFSTYSFGIYSSKILSNIYGDTAPLSQSFGWNTVLNLFYIPGAILGSFFSDLVGPRYALAIGVSLQGIVGFIMSGLYPTLSQVKNVPAFVVVYGIFLSLGEFGPGDNIGLLASKTSATGVRGQYYAVAAAIGKIGAFVGTYVFPYIEAAGGKGNASAQYPFYVSSSLCILSALLALFCLPHVGQDTITTEDLRFREYLQSKGWDTNQLGMRKGENLEAATARQAEVGEKQEEVVSS